jgi:hypothetical protein
VDLGPRVRSGHEEDNQQQPTALLPWNTDSGHKKCGFVWLKDSIIAGDEVPLSQTRPILTHLDAISVEGSTQVQEQS